MTASHARRAADDMAVGQQPPWERSCITKEVSSSRRCTTSAARCVVVGMKHVSPGMSVINVKAWALQHTLLASL